MFRYRQQDFLFLIIEFSDGKLKQKVFFHSVVVLMASPRKRASCCCLSVACIQTVALYLFYSFKSFSRQVLPNKKKPQLSAASICGDIPPKIKFTSLLPYIRTYIHVFRTILKTPQSIPNSAMNRLSLSNSSRSGLTN